MNTLPIIMVLVLIVIWLRIRSERKEAESYFELAGRANVQITERRMMENLYEINALKRKLNNRNGQITKLRKQRDELWACTRSRNGGAK